MARYRARNLIFIESALYQIGEEFESDLAPGRNWEPIDEEAKAKVAAANLPPMAQMVGEHRTPLTEIPADWRTMKGLDLINLARKLGLKPGKVEDARAKIEHELATRLEAAAA